MNTRTRKVAVVGTAALVLIATACGSDDDAASDTTEAGGAKVVKVTAADYSFSGNYANIDAGTKLTLTNSSAKEVHELVALRIPDAEKRKLADIVKLSEDEQNAIFGEAQPAMVLIAPPGGAPQITVPNFGDGTLTEPGRYAIICAIPVGADPAAFLKAMQEATDEPPDVPGGAPHFTEGMFAEVTVK